TSCYRDWSSDVCSSDLDEATSLQAIERNAPDMPVQSGSVAKQEFEYTRHGTTTLTAGLDVVTGEIISPTLQVTRTEPEFVDHIEIGRASCRERRTIRRA